MDTKNKRRHFDVDEHWPMRDMISPRWFLTALLWALWPRPTTVGTWPCTSSRFPKKRRRLLLLLLFLLLFLLVFLLLFLLLLLLNIVYWLICFNQNRYVECFLSRPWRMCREMQLCLGLNPESGEDVREESMAVVQLGQVDSVRSIHFFVASLRPLELSGL